jgi:hypothetical protein
VEFGRSENCILFFFLKVVKKHHQHKNEKPINPDVGDYPFVLSFKTKDSAQRQENGFQICLKIRSKNLYL